MRNCYDLARELITIMSDIDRVLEKKSKESVVEKWLILDSDLTRLENNMNGLIEKLKSIEVQE